MRITELELGYEDIMWFAVDRNGKILGCTSGVYGNVPEFVCESRENVELLIDFFLDKLQESTKTHVLRGNEFGKEFLEECKNISKKGIFCFDAYDGINHTSTYTKISIPENAISIIDLPQGIQKVLKKSVLDLDVEHIEVLEVTNAY